MTYQVSAVPRGPYAAIPFESFFETLFSPSFARSLVEDSDKAFTVQSSYPYNIKRIQDPETKALRKILIEFALAGFEREEIGVKAVDDEIRITTGDKASRVARKLTEDLAAECKKAHGIECDVDEVIDSAEDAEDDPEVVYLHHGISKRHLKVVFKLGSKMDKSGIKSTFRNGMLTVEVPAKADETKDIEIG